MHVPTEPRAPVSPNPSQSGPKAGGDPGSRGAVRSWWARVSNLGCTDEMDRGTGKRIRITNRIAIGIACLVLPYTAVFAWAQAWLLAALCIPLTALHLLVPAINARGHRRSASFTLVLAGNAAITFYSAALGSTLAV